MPVSPDAAVLAEAVAARLGVPRDGIVVVSGRAGRITCRVPDPDGDLFAKADVTPGAFQEEVEAMARLRSLGLPVCTVLDTCIGPPAILVSDWAPGRPLSAASPPGTLAEIGRILRMIHDQPAPPPFSGHSTVVAWISSWVKGLLPWWEGAGATQVDLRSALAWLAATEPLLATRAGTLMLFDGRPEHFLVDDQARVRMVDVADLQAGDGAMDLAVLDLDAPGILDGVLAGYAPVPEESTVLRDLVPFYAYLRALSAAEWQERMTGDRKERDRYLREASRRLSQHNAGLRDGSGPRPARGASGSGR